MRQKTPEHCKGCRYLYTGAHVPWCNKFGCLADKTVSHCKLVDGRELKEPGPLLELYYRVMKRVRLNPSKSRHHKET